MWQLLSDSCWLQIILGQHAGKFITNTAGHAVFNHHHIGVCIFISDTFFKTIAQFIVKCRYLTLTGFDLHLHLTNQRWK